jgi:hypothetical protein
MELDLLIDDIVNELPLHDKLGRKVLEPPDFFRIYHRLGFDIRGDVFKIVLALAPVPDPVFCKRPGIYLEEESVQICHMFLVENRNEISSSFVLALPSNCLTVCFHYTNSREIQFAKISFQAKSVSTNYSQNIFPGKSDNRPVRDFPQMQHRIFREDSYIQSLPHAADLGSFLDQNQTEGI